MPPFTSKLLTCNTINDIAYLKPSKTPENNEQVFQSFYEEENVWNKIELDNINVGFDYEYALECFCECGVSPEVDISEFEPSTAKSCPTECYSWLKSVTEELKKIAKEDNRGDTLFEVLQGCSQENIIRWVYSHPTYLKRM